MDQLGRQEHSSVARNSERRCNLALHRRGCASQGKWSGASGLLHENIWHTYHAAVSFAAPPGNAGSLLHDSECSASTSIGDQERHAQDSTGLGGLIQTAERDCSKSGIVYGSMFHVVPLIALQRTHAYTDCIPRHVPLTRSTSAASQLSACGHRVARRTMYYSTR